MSIMDLLLKGVPQSYKHTQTYSQVTIIAFRKCLSPVHARLFLCDTLSSENMCAFHSNYEKSLYARIKTMYPLSVTTGELCNFSIHTHPTAEPDPSGMLK